MAAPAGTGSTLEQMQIVTWSTAHLDCSRPQRVASPQLLLEQGVLKINQENATDEKPVDCDFLSSGENVSLCMKGTSYTF